MLRKLALGIVCLLSPQAFAFDVSTLVIGDDVSKFHQLTGPAKEFTTITFDPNNKIVRVFYRQEGMPADLTTQRIIINRICDKYGFTPNCSAALEQIESGNDELAFYQMYLKKASQILRARAVAEEGSLFSAKKLKLEIDLMDYDYSLALAREGGYSPDYSSAFLVHNEVPVESYPSNNTAKPATLTVEKTYVEEQYGYIEGRIATGVLLSIDGESVAVGDSGQFSYKGYVPTGGKDFVVVMRDGDGNQFVETVRLERRTSKQVSAISFDSLNPTKRQVEVNRSAIALIIGVAEYSKTAPAEFADKDAQVFYDYAHLKLGIPQNRIQTLVNDKADEVGLLTGVNKWLKRSVKQGESDVYIFFAGHGLASDDGDTAYLIPYDGAPDFLERTAISRDEVFREVSSVNPRSVTVFLDTCYSGDTRGESRLIAGRPLGIKLQEQSLPAGFTVLTAAGGDQIAKPLEEAQHGMFSYFLMKGMEGDADTDGNDEITARELHTYVRENVVQQSGGSQVPELQGDGEKVLVRFR